MLSSRKFSSAGSRKPSSRVPTEQRCTAFSFIRLTKQPAENFRLLLRPHGGPQSQFANEFDFEKQLFAANGYAVVLPNPRGSTGRGTEYAMGIYASWGGVDVQDDLAAVDDAIEARDRRSGPFGRRRMELRRDVDQLSHRFHDPFQSGGERRFDFEHPGRLRHRPIHPRL